MGKKRKEWGLYFLGLQISADGDCCSHEIKICLLFGKKAMTNVDSILKSKDITLPKKGLYNQNSGFPSSHVELWEWGHKEGWASKNWCFWIVMLGKTLESPLDCKDIKLVNPKGNQPWIFIGKTDADAKAPILWPPDVKNWLIRKGPDSGKDWEQRAGEEGGYKGWDG